MGAVDDHRRVSRALRSLGSLSRDSRRIATRSVPCDFNVAWELKDDVQAGSDIIGPGRLNAEQEAWIATLVCAARRRAVANDGFQVGYRDTRAAADDQ